MDRSRKYSNSRSLSKSFDKRGTAVPLYASRRGLKGRRWNAGFLYKVAVPTTFIGLLINIFFLHGSLPEVKHKESPSLADTGPQPQRRRTQGLHESITLRRMQAKMEEIRSTCHPSLYSLRRGNELRPFGLVSALEDYLQSNNNNNNNNNTQSATSCYAPLPYSTACHVSTYAILVTSEGDNLRQLFLNCLQWLLDPAATEIWLLLPLQAKASLGDDAAYGQRLLSWNQESKHPVRLIFADMLWDAVTQVDAQSAATTVLWMDGDIAWSDTRQMIQNGFTSWKQKSAVVHSASSWFQTIAQAFSADCSDAALRSSRMVMPTTVDLSFVFHHRDYLCFFQHPTMSALQKETTSWKEACLVAILWLLRISSLLAHSASAKEAAQFHPEMVTSQQRLAMYLSYLGGLPTASDLDQTQSLSAC